MYMTIIHERKDAEADCGGARYVTVTLGDVMALPPDSDADRMKIWSGSLQRCRATDLRDFALGRRSRSIRHGDERMCCSNLPGVDRSAVPHGRRRSHRHRIVER